MYTHVIGWCTHILCAERGRKIWTKHGNIETYFTGTLKPISRNLFHGLICPQADFHAILQADLHTICTHLNRLIFTQFAHIWTGWFPHNFAGWLATICTHFVRLIFTQFAHLLTFTFQHNFAGWLAHNLNTLKQANFHTICAYFDRLICTKSAHILQAHLHTSYMLNWGGKKQGQSTGTICTHCTGWAKRWERSMSAERDLKVRLSCL